MASSSLPRRAIISVSDKSNLVDFARELVSLGFELLSTSGSYKLLRENNIPAVEISAYTGFPEILEGRVKTLHPKIHGGILAKRGKDEAVLKNHGIDFIELVVVNLYPFEEKTSSDLTLPLLDAIEWVDIGGPTMIRAAAKNYENTAVVVYPSDYRDVIQELQNLNALSLQMRLKLAAKAFAHTAHYDKTIADYFEKQTTRYELFPTTLRLELTLASQLRYGENPHQRGAFYTPLKKETGTLATAKQIQGKPLSFNNLADADAALTTVKNFSALPACVIVKHANPCGAAIGQTVIEAYQKAYATDPTSAFGGIIAFNKLLDGKTAEQIIQNQFVEVILAPDFDSDALRYLTQKPNIRVLAIDSLEVNNTGFSVKEIKGGFLVQEKDVDRAVDNRVVTEQAPTDLEWQDLKFAWLLAKEVKSNAIIYAKNLQTVGIGAGQMSRIDSAKIASFKAAEASLDLKGAVMASDAFFPFRDSVDLAAKMGISAIIQPGGSVKDAEVIAAANEHGLKMVFTGVRHFKH